MRKGTLADFFANSPLPGSDLKIERVKGEVREIDLDDSSEEVGGAHEDHPRLGGGSNVPDRDRG